jgi:ribonuclease P protein component
MEKTKISNGTKRPGAFGKLEKVKRSFEYKRLIRKGTFYKDGVFVLTILRNNLRHHRLGISVGSSKVSLASRRNRIKRLIREVYRLNKSRLKGGSYDILISLRKTPPENLAYSELEQRIKVLLKKADVYD